jgi:hypothetical protein
MRGLSMGVNHHDVPLLTENRELPNLTLLLLDARLLPQTWLGIVTRNYSVGYFESRKAEMPCNMQQV